MHMLQLHERQHGRLADAVTSLPAALWARGHACTHATLTSLNSHSVLIGFIQGMPCITFIASHILNLFMTDGKITVADTQCRLLCLAVPCHPLLGL